MRNVPKAAKTRSAAAGKGMPGKTRSAAANHVTPKASPDHGTTKDGTKPRKGVLSRGGGHG